MVYEYDNHSDAYVLSDTRCHILASFRDMLPLLATPQQYVGFLSHLFMWFDDLQARALLCEVMVALSRCVEELEPIVQLINDMNAFNPSRISEYDFDKRYVFAVRNIH